MPFVPYFFVNGSISVVHNGSTDLQLRTDGDLEEPANESIFYYEGNNLANITSGRSVFYQMRLKNCVITSGLLLDCILEDCTTTNVMMKHCQVLKSPIALRRFTPEIRVLIFGFVMGGDQGIGEIPALVKATIGDQGLYKEALDIMYKQCPVPVHAAVNMPEHLMNRITKLSVKSVDSNH